MKSLLNLLSKKWVFSIIFIWLWAQPSWAYDPDVIDQPKISCKDFWQANGVHQRLFPQSQSPSEYKKYLNSLSRHECQKDWTILVYMQGDNDLSPYALWDLLEMESTFSGLFNGSTVNVDVLVQVDLEISRQVQRLHMFQSNTPMPVHGVEYYKKKDLTLIQSPRVKILDEKQLAQTPQVQAFEDFVYWGLAQYPSKHTMIVLWGHGEGWSLSNLVQFGGMALDYTDHQRISLVETKQALMNIKNISIEQKPIDVIVADACLMQTVEVGHELKDVARYMIGSTQIQNFMGLPYRQILYEINSKNWHGLDKTSFHDEPHLMAKMIPLLAKESLDPNSKGVYTQGQFDPKAFQTFTMSSVYTQSIEDKMIPALASLIQEIEKLYLLEPLIKDDLVMIIEQMPRFLGGSRDFSTFLAYLKEYFLSDIHGLSKTQIEDVLAALNLNQNAIKYTLIERVYGPTYFGLEEDNPYFLGHFKALGLWLPPNERQLRLLSPELNQSSFYKAFAQNAWSHWLHSLYKF